MWQLNYYINKITLTKLNNNNYNNLEEINRNKNIIELYTDPMFLESIIFGNGKTFVMNKNDQNQYHIPFQPEIDKESYFIDEKMKVSNKFLKTNGIYENYYVVIRNYFDFNDDDVIYVRSSQIIDMEEYHYGK